MKRLFASLFIVLLLLMVLNSCGESKVYKIGISQCSSDDWRSKMNEEIMREAMLHDDIEVVIKSANDNSSQQINDIKYFVDHKFDVIMVAPNEAESLTPVIKEIYDKGIPVIIFDRNINDSSYTQYFGVDNVGLGRSAGKYALSLLPTIGSDSLFVMEVYGLRGSTPAEDRMKGFRAAIENGPVEIIASGTGNWNKEDAEKVVDSMLRLYPETNLIFAHNDRMAIGASEIARKIGRDDIKIIGVDAAPNIGIRAVADSLIDATFLYPTEGHLLLREGIKLAYGEEVERQVMLPLSSAVDLTNADILLLQNEQLEEDTKKVELLKRQLDFYLSKYSAQKMLVLAFIAILILLFGLLFLVLRTFWQHRRHREELLRQNRLLEEERDKQKELNEKLEQATQSKLVFFTNVSHDLRTPLTLIAEPVSQLNVATNLNERQKKLVRIADKNVKILQRLINQILDFRKYENDKLSLNLTEIDFRKTIEEWVESFYNIAKKRDIRLILTESELKEGELLIAIDVEKIERVFFNLISNALKYSPDNSTITVSYGIKDSELVLKVADTGEGISRDDIKNIFDRFFQVERVRPRGSGIGLSLAKAFIELHGGNITVESELNKGSVFTIILPIKHVADKPQDVEKFITEADVYSELEYIDTEVEFSDDKPLLLIIDDNRDIRDMLTELMKDDYNILTAANGKDGLRKASRYVPDLIICDVMMPGMDGMELCSRLKSEQVTSHIPVLMLTACSMDEQRVQGFESGADGYLAKPFPSEVLKAQSASLIANRKKIKDLFNRGGIKLDNSSVNAKLVSIKSGDIDNEFYNKFLNLFEEQMGNPDLNVETLASEMGFERTQFYRKIKAITNYSPVELMRNLRLKRARVLLTTSEKTVSEIGYEVGFSTPAYFTKCYREMFGETPTETRQIH